MGPHPRLVRYGHKASSPPRNVFSKPCHRYLGWQEGPELPQGLLLARASHGSLQQQLDERGDVLSLPLRLKWCHQAIESIAYIHGRGVLHSDLRPENFLVHDVAPSVLPKCAPTASTAPGLISTSTITLVWEEDTGGVPVSLFSWTSRLPCSGLVPGFEQKRPLSPSIPLSTSP